MVGFAPLHSGCSDFDEHLLEAGVRHRERPQPHHLRRGAAETCRCSERRVSGSKLLLSRPPLLTGVCRPPLIGRPGGCWANASDAAANRREDQRRSISDVSLRPIALHHASVFVMKVRELPIPSSAHTDGGLHERVDSFGQPQQCGARGTMQRELVSAVKHGVAQLREAALYETALEESEPAQRPESIVVAERNQPPKSRKLNGGTG